MGLDITAYEKVRLVKAMTAEESNALDYDEPGETLLYLDHPSRTQHDGMPEGSYAYAGRKMSFRAGSYSGHNWWRSKLAEMTGTTDEALREQETRSGPFVALICFSDCEGFIGPKTSAALASDFEAWRVRAVEFSKTVSKDGAYWLGIYEKWASAFTIASKEGVVAFR